MRKKKAMIIQRLSAALGAESTMWLSTTLAQAVDVQGEIQFSASDRKSDASRRFTLASLPPESVIQLDGLRRRQPGKIGSRSAEKIDGGVPRAVFSHGSSSDRISNFGGLSSLFGIAANAEDPTKGPGLKGRG